MDLEALTRVVDERFAAMNPQGWPDPHPDLSSPADDEYSRVTDPQKYRILMQRCEAWFDVLTTELDARIVEQDRSLAPARPDTFGEYKRVITASGARSGTVDLWVMLREVPGDTGPLPVVEFAVARPAAMFLALPQCGCDACDDGSEYLLSEVDEVFASVVTGTLVVELHRKRTSVEMINSSSSSSGDLRTPEDAQGRFSGQPWL